MNKINFKNDVGFEVILNWPDFNRWLSKIESADLVVLDAETSSLDELVAHIVGLSFCITPGNSAYIPLTHDYFDVPKQLQLDIVLARLKPWLESSTRAKLGQNIKYDRHIFANHGIEVRGYAHDTMLQSYVLEAHMPHGLDSLAARHLGCGGLSYKDICDSSNFCEIDIFTAANYSCNGVSQTLKLHNIFLPQIESSSKFSSTYQLEIKSSEALYRIERNGVLVDMPMLMEQGAELDQKIMALEADAFNLAGSPFNLSSPKQLAEILFDRLGLAAGKKTANGARSTNEEVLESLAGSHPLPEKILEHRHFSKLKSTYIDKLTQIDSSRTGRIHTHYAQAVAVTGRLSSNEPNFQNIPVKTMEGRRIRSAFVAPHGSLIASADYSQIELRIIAHASNDVELLNAFRLGLDIHSATAAEVFGVALNEVSKDQRRHAKAINFGVIYGMSSFGLAKAMGVPNKTAEIYIDRYFERHPGMKQYLEATRMFAREYGYVETLFGRRLYLPEINSGSKFHREAMERTAINAPMQGTAADLIKMSMVAVQAALEGQNLGTKLIMQVHDELVLEVPANEVEWVETEVTRIMSDIADFQIPLQVDIGFGINWDAAH